ncbi:helix-turn-helix domain-containing protein [Rhodopseudomonas sp. BR0M22]|uniref:helix-turn-helix domain-containing protein n=1 Tax=Rhodopseudomonas sp. BR0M22 TaxID=2269369 RepID=UPI0013DFB015|nr:helix-turn-helix domain-containing protein [Rhodopseudomonas sp. BR0M22]MCD0419047.1 helix-turn-helix domain-containing protein [Rubrivivax sp. JA1024]NEW93608.1 helix-turn-helix domain-containing protein [Rhodopseudomonas sp. BR0M22]
MAKSPIKSSPKKPASKAAAKREATDVANWKRSDGIKAPLLSAKVLNSPDPHALDQTRDNILEVAIGREVRNFRNQLGINISELAEAAGISLGMLSKIENGMTSPSLTTLQALARALSVPVSSFFRRYEERRSVSFVKAGEGLAIERRGTRSGHQYHLLGYNGDQNSRLVVEPYMITLTSESDVFPLFQHPGMEFLYMLEGSVVYRHAEKRYTMLPGDSLFFDADAPHGPEQMVTLPIRFLSIICYVREND